MDTKFRGPPTIDKRDVCPRISKSSRRRGEKEKKKENIRASRGSVEIETLKVVLGAKEAYVTVHRARCAQVRRHKRTSEGRKLVTHGIKHVASCLSLVAHSPDATRHWRPWMRTRDNARPLSVPSSSGRAALSVAIDTTIG